MSRKDDINIPTFDIRIDELPQTKRFPLQIQISISEFMSLGIELYAKKKDKSPFNYIRDYLFDCLSYLIFNDGEYVSNPRSLKFRLRRNELCGVPIKSDPSKCDTFEVIYKCDENGKPIPSLDGRMVVAMGGFYSGLVTDAARRNNEDVSKFLKRAVMNEVTRCFNDR